MAVAPSYKAFQSRIILFQNTQDSTSSHFIATTVVQATITSCLDYPNSVLRPCDPVKT